MQSRTERKGSEVAGGTDRAIYELLPWLDPTPMGGAGDAPSAKEPYDRHGPDPGAGTLELGSVKESYFVQAQEPYSVAPRRGLANLAVVNIKPEPESERDEDGVPLASKWGVLSQILDDLSLLGVTRLRQVGRYDLVWDALAGGVPIPVGQDAIDDLILTDHNLDKIAFFLSECYARGLKPRFMFFSPGGGHKPANGWVPDVRAPTASDASRGDSGDTAEMALPRAFR